MSNPLLDDIGQELISEGLVGGETGWILYKGFLPASLPTNPTEQIIALFETGVGEPDIIRDFSTGEKSFDNTSFQVRGRSAVNSYQALRNKMEAIFNALHQTEPAKVSGQNYVYVYCKQATPLPLGKDDANRDSMTLNFSVMRQR